MTNYNERLYEIIDKHRHDVDMDFSADIRHYKNTNETVDGITSLIKELVAEANLPNEYQDRLLKMLENENGIGSTS